MGTFGGGRAMPDEAGSSDIRTLGRPLMRKRVNAALDVFKQSDLAVVWIASKNGAIGFCFGGGVVWSWQRSGKPRLTCCVLHGNLDLRTPMMQGDSRRQYSCSIGG